MSKNATIPEYAFLLPMESSFNPVKGHAWISNWFCVPVAFSFIYVLGVFLGQRWMSSRPPADLQRVLVVWNAVLATFSLLACARTTPELTSVLIHRGWRHSICFFPFYEEKVTGFWSHLFILSKLAELLDTAFLVLRKRKVTFLHWFHHASVLIFSWFLGKERSGLVRWFMNMNLIVHSLMYTYYALMAVRFKLPRVLALCITSLQILQMIIGFSVGIQGLFYWISGIECNLTGISVASTILIYGVYLVLFVNFFLRNYLRNDSKKKST